MAEKVMQIQNVQQIAGLFGDFDHNLNALETEYQVVITNRGEEVKISGSADAVKSATLAIEGMLLLLQNNQAIDEQSMQYVFDSVSKDGSLRAVQQLTRSDCICVTVSGKPVKAKTVGQQQYIDSIAKNTVVFGVGPAGTGKTYLAVAMAVKAFKAGEVQRIILTRPAVEAGENLGFLPGDLQTKVDPYLRPLYDALFDMLGEESFNRQMEKGTIEVAPLAYMRGRSLNESFIILDEAQNTTKEQMKMFLTRLGFQSKAVVTGDITQIDLPTSKRSGLVDSIHILKNVDQIAIQRFSDKDVVRSKIVQDIIKAYETHHHKEEQRNHRKRVKKDEEK